MRELPDELRALVERVKRCWEVADAEHKPHRDRWDGYFRQYHSYTDFKRTHAQATTPRDRDSVLRDGQREFGAQLYIPYTFTVIETILPRMLSNRPRMLWLPRDRDSARNTENMRWLLDAQQERIGYELSLQTTGKTGLILGIGVQKVWWDYCERTVPIVAKGRFRGWRKAMVRKPIYDDPRVEDVDPYDFLWEPSADRIANAGWVFHRTWRSTEYVLERLQSGEWDLLPDARELTATDLVGGARGEYDTVWRGRRQAQGYSSSSVKREDSTLHEVWEYHTPTEVITIVDREMPVRSVQNPAWHGELPFHLYRPTENLHCMVGKGEPEPIESLQDEMNTMRSQRRDNATMKLQTSWFVEDGVIDPYDMRWGAGIMNVVNSGGMNLRDVLVPMQTGDIPNSSYREEDALRADIERVSGISDQTAGATLASETATGAQLVQAAANVRIQNKTRRLELELIAGGSRHMMLLSQQRIVSNRDVRIPTVPEPGSSFDQAWAWRTVGPGELAGVWDIVPEGGSTAPDNVPQDRSDAQALLALVGNPMVNGRALLVVILEKMGMRHPEAYLAPDQHVPPQTLDAIVEFLVTQVRMPLDQARGVVQQALQMGQQQEQQQLQGAAPADGAQPAQQPAQAA